MGRSAGVKSGALHAAPAGRYTPPPRVADRALL